MFTGIARAVRIIVVLALSAGISGPKNTAARAYAQERATAQATFLDKYPGQPPLPPSVIKREDLTRVVRADTKTERTPLPKPVEDPIQPSGEITKPLDAPLPEPRTLPFVAPKNDTPSIVTAASYTVQGQLAQRTGGGNFWMRNYAYDSVGNVTSASDASESLGLLQSRLTKNKRRTQAISLSYESTNKSA